MADIKPFLVRKASPEDKDKVLGINDNVYEGEDYLPDLYDYWQKCCQHITSYVYEQEGEIVSRLFVIAFYRLSKL